MELNDIQEMTFVDIEKTLAGNEKKILSNLSKIQKLSDENAKLVTESKMLNEQKTQKLLQEMQNRILDSVEILLAPPKAKSQKKDKTQKNISPPEVEISDSVEAVSERSVDCGT